MTTWCTRVYIIPYQSRYCTLHILYSNVYYKMIYITFVVESIASHVGLAGHLCRTTPLHCHSFCRCIHFLSFAIFIKSVLALVCLTTSILHYWDALSWNCNYFIRAESRILFRDISTMARLIFNYFCFSTLCVLYILSDIIPLVS